MNNLLPPHLPSKSVSKITKFQICEMAVSCPLTIKTYLGSAWGGGQIFFLLKTSKKTEKPQDQFRFFQFSGEVVAFQEKTKTRTI